MMTLTTITTQDYDINTFEDLIQLAIEDALDNTNTYDDFNDELLESLLKEIEAELTTEEYIRLYSIIENALIDRDIANEEDEIQETYDTLDDMLRAYYRDVM